MSGLKGGDNLPTNKAAWLDAEGLGTDVAPYLAAGVDFDPSGANAANDDPLHDDVLGRDVGAHQPFPADEDSAGDCDIAFKDTTDV